jgi:hypothetical protein
VGRISFVFIQLSNMRTIMYIQLSQFETNLRSKSDATNRFRAFFRMPFAGPETAMASTVGCGVDSEANNFVALVLRPARRSLRLFNHLHEDSTTYVESSNGIRIPVRVLRRVEHHVRRRIGGTAAELRRRLPGLLQAECSAR